MISVSRFMFGSRWSFPFFATLTLLDFVLLIVGGLLEVWTGIVSGSAGVALGGICTYWARTWRKQR